MKSNPGFRIWIILATGSATALFATTGCVAVAAGAGAGAAVACLRGDLDATLGAGLDRSIRVANQAVQQLEFSKVSASKDVLQALLIARNARDRRIEIRLD